MSTHATRRPIHSDEALLDAARAVFSASGFEAASMDAIAAAAGATKPTLYGRFDSKKALYEQAVARDADALIEHLFAAYSVVADAPVGVMVAASMEAYFDFFERCPDAFGLLFASGRSEPAVVMAERVLDAITDRLADMVAAVLARTGRPASDSTRPLAGMLLGIAHHGVAAARRDPALDARRAQRLATDLALSGLRHMGAEALNDRVG
jgi:AcrR family transcriptional regulator